MARRQVARRWPALVLALVSLLAASGARAAVQHPDAPKLIPLSALDRYQEGAELKLFCSASAPVSAGRLQFEWRKNQAELLSMEAGAGLGPASGLASVAAQSKQHIRIAMMDDSSSVLRISRLEADDSANYTCLARNQHGFDSSTVRVLVNVRLKWTREPPGELQVRAGRPLQIDCDASGQPPPLISWTSLKDRQTIHGKVLRLERAHINDSGLYECRAQVPVAPSGEPGHNQNAAHSHHHLHAHAAAHSESAGETLRKIVRVTVNGK